LDDADDPGRRERPRTGRAPPGARRQPAGAEDRPTDRALAAFSAGRFGGRRGRVGDPGLFDAEAESKAARLAVDLEAARAREKALEEAGEQASEALGRAIAEIRAALGDESLITEGVHDDEEDDGRGRRSGRPVRRPRRR
jgi:hypothetical protein